MITYLAEVEPAEEEFFRAELPGHDLRFVANVEEVGEDAEIVSSLGSTAINREYLAAHPRLVCVAVRSGAVEHVDLHASEERGVVVCQVPDFGESTAAEHTFALILALSRRLREVMADSKVNEHFAREEARGVDLCGKTLGIVGLGRLGRRVMGLAQAFQMRVVAFDPAASPEKPTMDGAFEYVSLEVLLERSDVISLHTSLSPWTHHLLNRKSLARCRAGVMIVNTAHGGLIDTAALDEALETGQVGGAGLDVLEEERVMREPVSKIITGEIVDRLRSDAEPHEVHHGTRVHGLHKLMTSDSLLARKNVVFTPHVAFHSVEAVQRLNTTTAANIRAFAAGKPVNVVRA